LTRSAAGALHDGMSALPIPASTLVILRDRIGRAPELLMVERAATMAFAAGAMVFPGGRIDPDDYRLAEVMGLGDDGPARIAAIRETIEEVGLAIGVAPTPSAATVADLRAKLHAGMPFAQTLAAHGLTLIPDALTPFARWLPDHPGMRIFDTLFFLARAPADVEVEVDGTENVRLVWTTAAQALAAADAGEATIIYPTRRNLERLARFDSHAAACADAAAFPMRTITPFVEERDGVLHLCIPADCGYPVTAEPMTAVRRH
jgi:8-oxo-dGTP pyrophosphatase MutT (NUDIX family)